MLSHQNIAICSFFPKHTYNDINAQKLRYKMGQFILDTLYSPKVAMFAKVPIKMVPKYICSRITNNNGHSLHCVNIGNRKDSDENNSKTYSQKKHTPIYVRNTLGVTQ